MIYFNNAATSHPKPDGVAQAVSESLVAPPSNPYRENVTKKSVVEVCRERLAELFRFSDPNRVIFCSGSTEALNIAIHGLMGDPGHVLTTQVEHNAVLRPLRYLESAGRAVVEILPCEPPGFISPETFAEALRKDTVLAVVNHVSNVTGACLPVSEFYEICEARNIPLIIDASQSAGALELDFSSMPLAVLAFTGHKTLMGPKGIGGLLIGEHLDLKVWKAGGTGIRSDIETMPDLWPVKYEAGTMNEPGIAGLAASVGYVLERTVPVLQNIKMELVKHAVEEMEKMPGLRIISERPEKNRCGIACFNVNGWDADDIGYVLSDSFDIRVRTGLHCAPLIHKAIGTFPKGAVRASFSSFNTHEEIDTFAGALKTIAG